MIQQVLHKQFLQDFLAELHKQVQPSSGQRRGATRSPLDAMERPKRDELRAGIEAAQAHLSATETDVQEKRGKDGLLPAERNCYVPPSPEVANLQSAIEWYFLEKRPSVIESPRATGRRGSQDLVAGSRFTIWTEYLKQDQRRIFGAFEQTDVGWVNSKLAEGLRLFRGKHPFVGRPARSEPISVPDKNVRMIVFGDWGSGIPRAQKVAGFIRKELEDPKVKEWQRHVIHLGDVYYSGWEYEYKNRFLKYWPVKPEEKHVIGSFTLNGNHDMFSGGWAYYDYALADPRFAAWQGKSSLFHMCNSHWQLFGLDTSYEDKGLEGTQAEWISSAARKGLKTMLLSHHQYVSSFEKPAKTLIDKIGPVICNLDVAAWLWGHEHRCMTYKDVPGIRFARCLGHGGVPVYQMHDIGGPTPAPGEWEYRDFIESGLELWAKFGFAVLDFYDDKISVRYVNETGTTDKEETLQ